MDIITSNPYGQTYNYDAVFASTNEDATIQLTDFLNLMVQQLSNQDFTNPVDDTQYLTQMAQFATMSSMEELASYSKSSYVYGLIGQNVTVASMSVGGNFESDTGPIEMISLVDNEYTIQVNGKTYDLSQIMQIHSNTNNESSVDLTNKAIEATDITSISAKFNWPAATTDALAKDKVTYSVYYSVSSLMDDVDKIKEYGKLIGEADRTEITSESISGLDPDTTYYVNVIVKDENNVEHIYQMESFKTEAKS